MNLFLRARHWQLFILTFGLPMVFNIVLFVYMFAKLANHQGDPVEIFNVFKFFPLVMLLYVAILFGWYWSVAMNLQPLLPENIKMKTTKFKVFFFIPIIYMGLITTFMFTLLSWRPVGVTPDSMITIASTMALIIPVHLFSMFCIFYCLYFVAKTIKTVEIQKEVSFSDFMGEFFLIWFFPIGVWIIQPRINKLIASKIEITE